jgi:hypothetical protein
MLAKRADVVVIVVVVVVVRARWRDGGRIRD